MKANFARERVKILFCGTFTLFSLVYFAIIIKKQPTGYFSFLGKALNGLRFVRFLLQLILYCRFISKSTVFVIFVKITDIVAEFLAILPIFKKSKGLSVRC